MNNTTTVGRIRGITWLIEEEFKVSIKDGQIVFAGKEHWSNQRMATVLTEAIAKGNDVLLLFDDQSYFVNKGYKTSERVEVENCTVLCAFDNNYAEVYPQEGAYGDVDVVIAAVDSYPCKIQTNGAELIVSQDEIHFDLCDDDSEEFSVGAEKRRTFR